MADVKAAVNFFFFLFKVFYALSFVSSDLDYFGLKLAEIIQIIL